jgi:plastocyanin
VTSRGRRSIVGGAVLAILVAACSTADGYVAPPPSPPPGGAVIVAHGLAFDQRRVDVPAGAGFQLLFDNRDGVLHNVTILDDRGNPLFAGEIFSGPGSRIYAVSPLPAGTHPFRCDVHQDMTGTVVAR